MGEYLGEGQATFAPGQDADGPSLMYIGTTGYVAGSDTSEAQAKREVMKAPTMQKTVSDVIHMQLVHGCTSAEVEAITGFKHQSASAAIRNMELDGKLAKTNMIRNGQHAYVTQYWASQMDPDTLLPPNPRRVSYKKKYDGLRAEIGQIAEEMALDTDQVGLSIYWYGRLARVLNDL
jgi:hypothetical protein